MTSSSIPLTTIYATISDLFITVYNYGSIVPFYPHSSDFKYLFIFYTCTRLIPFVTLSPVPQRLTPLTRYRTTPDRIVHTYIYIHRYIVKDESTKRNTLCLKCEFNVDCCSDRMNFYSSASEILSRGTKNNNTETCNAIFF